MSFCHNTLACSAQVIGILYFSFLTASHPLSLLHFPILHFQRPRAVDSVDSVDFVDRTVDEIEVDFVANVYEA